MRMIKSALVGLLLTAATAPAKASGVPTVDVAAIAQAITQYQEMLTQTGILDETAQANLRQVQQNLDRLRQLQEQINAMTGSRDMAGILEGANYDFMNDILPTDLLGTDGSQAAERFLLLLEEDAPNTAEQHRVFQPDGRFARTHVDATERVYLALSGSDSFIEGMPRIDDVYADLIAKVDDTDDIKAALDLNARIAAENGRAINRLTQLMALQISSEAAVRRRDIAREEDRRPYDPARASDLAEQITIDSAPTE